MKLIDTIELLTEILVGKKEENHSQKKTRTTNIKTKRKTKRNPSGSNKRKINEYTF